MTEYHKIDSMFKRDGKRLMIDERAWTRPEFEYLAGNDWLFTEKVDGTNIRLYFHGDETPHAALDVKGRTDNASIPPKLLARCAELLDTMPLAQQFPDASPDATVVLYGEGYGVGIQSGGKYIRDGVDFVLFDVTVGEWVLSRENVEKVAAGLGIDVVPIVGQGTLEDAITVAREGFVSQWPGVDIPEGLVCRPAVDLWNRKGERVITKIKARDFK